MNTQIHHNENGKINIIFNDKNKFMNNNNKQYLTNNEHLKYIDEQFNSFIGLNHVKNSVKEIYATTLINKHRIKVGLQPNRQVLHMLFKGNPGTGKTTIARKLADVLFQLNILSKGHFVEVERADLVGEYIGQTAQKTRAIIQQSIGGVLFIDEAYSLARGGHKDFGREAIDTLVKQMEDHAEDFVLILAGYPNEMDTFLQMNPGLKSRFPFHIHFKNYTIHELIEIACQMVEERDYQLSSRAIQKTRIILQEELNENDVHFSNARYIRNIIEKSIRLQAIRLLNHNIYSFQQLKTITDEDIKKL